MDKKVFELDFYGRKIVVEHGQVAKQADGAVLVRYGDTVVLSTAVVSKSANLLSDFFPLMVFIGTDCTALSCFIQISEHIA